METAAASGPQQRIHPVGAVYTAITKGYDRHLRFKVKGEGVRFDIKRLPALKTKRENTLAARRIKILEAPQDCEWSLWIDGSMEPKTDLRKLVDEWLDGYDMALMIHPERICAYKEVKACIGAGKKIPPEAGAAAVEKLKELGHPEQWGLWAQGVWARRSGIQWIKEAEHKLYELMEFVHRDQLWLPTIVREMGVKNRIRTVHANVFKNKWFRYWGHAPR